MDKEYIEREELINQIRLMVNRSSVGETSLNDISAKTICSLILEAPTADVVEVVRCKNCKHFITDTFKRTMCNRTFTMFEMNENDFCSYGERKEGAEE